MKKIGENIISIILAIVMIFGAAFVFPMCEGLFDSDNTDTQVNYHYFNVK